MTASDQQRKLLELVRSSIERDEALRDQFEIGDKFRFIRDRLKALLSRVDEHVQAFEAEVIKNEKTVVEDEVLVFVHLFNAQGLTLQTWQKFISPTLFYEYGINRPIYAEKAHIDALLRSRPSKVQHAYLTVAIKPGDVVKKADEVIAKDQIGNPLIKVKEGALKVERLIAFTHNDIEYELDSLGRLTKKLEK